jgi:NAD(P)-dependent dehydrogenase (short-subunit alcohol dehydrogenase family)
MWTTMGPDRPSYGLTKSAAMVLVQQIAKDTKPGDMQIVSYHPGGVMTDSLLEHVGEVIYSLKLDHGTTSLPHNISLS